VHRRLAALATLLIAAFAAACSDRRAPAGDSDAAVPSAGSATGVAPERDDFGDSIATPATAPRRIVSLNPTTTELLFAIGAGRRVVGRTHWDSWPDSARLVPDLGDGLRPNVEAVLATRPDLVVLYASADNRAAAQQLRAAGVATLALKVDRIADFRRAVRLLGAAAREPRRAQVVVDSVDQTLQRVRRETSGFARPTVFWHVWDAPLITIGAGSYMNELVEIAGGRNVYADLPDPSPRIAMEDLLHRDPDVILAGPIGAQEIASNPAWRPLRAVREGRVLALDTALVGRPSVRLGEAAVAIASLLHPEAPR